MTTAQDLFDKAFGYPRDARSGAYRAGVLDAIRYWMGERLHLSVPFSIGTAEADAWFYGTEEGARLVRSYNAARKEAT